MLWADMVGSEKTWASLPDEAILNDREAALNAGKITSIKPERSQGKE